MSSSPSSPAQSTGGGGGSPWWAATQRQQQQQQQQQRARADGSNRSRASRTSLDSGSSSGGDGAANRFYGVIHVDENSLYNLPSDEPEKNRLHMQ
ncbi:hypothetical protein HK405_000331, partial [Cladochytrium tenue]